MSSKQDAVATRTAVDLERKYSFGKTFAEVMGYATDAQNAAEEAKTAVAGLNQEEIFKRLTNNGQAQGIYRDPDTGEIYINASYLATGTIASADGSACIDLSSGIAEFFNGLISNGLFVRSKATDDVTLFYVSTANNSKGKPFFNAGARSADGNNLFQLTESFDGTSGEPSGAYMQIHSADGSSSLHMSASNDRVGVSLYGSSGISGVALSVDENGTGNVFTNKINGKPIDALFTTTPLTLTQADQTNYTLTSIAAYSRSGMVDIHVNAKVVTASTGWLTVATLPSGYRPPVNIYRVESHYNSAAGNANIRMRILPGGAIQLSLGTVGASYAFHDTFIMA